MDTTIQEISLQIRSLEEAKKFHQEKYLNNIRIIDDKIQRVEKQIDRSKSQVKRDLLKRNFDWYENEIIKMDEAISIVTKKIDDEISRLHEVLKSVQMRQENERNSFEYNIENIRNCCKNRNTATIFEALESVANALEIIRAERCQT
jgi:uncharacterized protein Yka (UPF0111/DUF47 family)